MYDEIIVMYLGVVVEKTSAEELFQKPLHPYTKALLSAIPRINIRKKAERILLRGEITSPIDLPPMCRFAPRCNYADETCFRSDPPLREFSPGHYVACHLTNLD